MYNKMAWDEWYVLALGYYNHYGDLKVKQYFKTKNGYDYDEGGYKLGVWLNNQHTRNRNGLLTEEQRKKLENLGMNFQNTHDLRWNRMYELAKVYFQHYGNLKIKYNFRTLNGFEYNENGYSLGTWLNEQRTSYRRGYLTPDRIERLEELGAILKSVREDNWHTMYVLAQAYYKHHGNLKIPAKFNTKNGFKKDKKGKDLGRWISVQRSGYRQQKLSLEHIQKLQEIGMIFENVHSQEWDRLYNLAQTYYEYHGNLKVEKNFKTKDGYTYNENGQNLDNWLNSQRTLYSNGLLSLERIRKLQLIGMIFELRKNKNDNIALCQEYGIDYRANKNVIDSIAHRELISKINYLTSSGIPLTSEGILHPIFAMGNVNMQVRYGINLETLITEYSVKNKEKTIKGD